MAVKKQYTKREIGEWFTRNAEDALGIRKNITQKYDRQVSFPSLGGMYFFAYDPKWKAVLPIYDKFPLVLPIERYEDGFLGLNLHYLDQGTRKALLDKLAEYASDTKMNRYTRLKLSYNLLKASSVSKTIEPCIKRYLTSHVRSRFIEINPNEWDKAIQLPVADFVTKK